MSYYTAMRRELEKQARVLTMKGREQIKEKNFAIPKGDGPGETGKYPIHDTRHAKNALTRVEQYGTPGEKAKVYAAVAKKYPGLSRESSVPEVKEKAKKAEAEKKPDHPAKTLAKGVAGMGLGMGAGYLGMKGIQAATGGQTSPVQGSKLMWAVPLVTGTGGLIYSQMQGQMLDKMRKDHLKRQEMKRGSKSS